MPVLPVFLISLNEGNWLIIKFAVSTELQFRACCFSYSLGFNIVLYGLGSKRDLLERFRTTMLQDCIHIVINGFFPGISVKSVSFKNVLKKE